MNDRFPTGSRPVPEGGVSVTGSRFPTPTGEPDPRDRVPDRFPKNAEPASGQSRARP